MKVIRNKLIKTAIVLSLMSLSSAHAMSGEIVSSSVVSKQFDVRIINKLPAATLKINQTSLLQSGVVADKTPVAQLVMMLSEKLTGVQRAAIRWTPSKATIGQSPDRASFSGVNNPNNKLNVVFSSPSSVENLETDGWYASGSQETSIDFSVSTDGEQTLVADQYNLYLDAGVFTM